MGHTFTSFYFSILSDFFSFCCHACGILVYSLISRLIVHRSSTHVVKLPVSRNPREHFQFFQRNLQEIPSRHGGLPRPSSDALSDPGPGSPHRPDTFRFRRSCTADRPARSVPRMRLPLRPRPWQSPSRNQRTPVVPPVITRLISEWMLSRYFRARYSA